MTFVARSGSLWINPYVNRDSYNGIECEAETPGATLRHFYGTDVIAAINAAGQLNGRSRDLAIAREILAAAIRLFGPVREVYFLDNRPEVVVSFGNDIKNRLWIANGYINSLGQLHSAQYLFPIYKDMWRVDLVDQHRRKRGSDGQGKTPASCTECGLRLPIAPVDSCPSCGSEIVR